MKDGRQSAASSEIIHAKPPAGKAARLKSFQKNQGLWFLISFIDCFDVEFTYYRSGKILRIFNRVIFQGKAF